MAGEKRISSMVIIYNGGVEWLQRELAATQEVLDLRYAEILGARASVVEAEARRLLSAKAFVDMPDEYSSRFGGNAGSNELVLGIIGDKRLQDNGTMRSRELTTVPFMYVSEEGFRLSETARFTDKIVASYVHEFNHFVGYVLQNVPFYVVKAVLAEHVMGDVWDFDRFIDDMDERKVTRDWHARWAVGAMCEQAEEFYEKVNRILDRAVLSAIGIDVSLEWRGQKRTYAELQMNNGQKVRYAVGGDPFIGLSDTQVIEKYLAWQDTFQPMGVQFIDRFLQSAASLKVERKCIDDVV